MMGVQAASFLALFSILEPRKVGRVRECPIHTLLHSSTPVHDQAALLRGHVEAVLEQHRQEGREANAALMKRVMEQVGF